jgi:hypothetical protein
MSPDREYEMERNKLIPIAEAKANDQYGKQCISKNVAQREKWVINWNKIFHETMNLLWINRHQHLCKHCGGKGYV